MSSVLDQPFIVDTSAELPYLGLLREHHDAMVTRLIEVHGISPDRARAMIDQLPTRLVKRIVKEHQQEGVDLATAWRILNEALGFLKLAAREGGHGPALLVDIGWHALLLYTLEYEVLCWALAGRFLHHCPTDVVGFSPRADRKPCECTPDECEVKPALRADGTCEAVGARIPFHPWSRAETIAAMQRLGPVDLELWLTFDKGPGPKQGHCNSDTHCSGS